MIVFGDEMLDDVLGLLDGKGDKKPLAATPRYQKAFAQLHVAEDAKTFFDVQAMLASLRQFADEAVAAVGSSSKDTVTNAYFNEEANKLAQQGVEAYQQGDYQQALDHTKKAHEVAPTDSRIMYNVACFQAMLGNKDESLSWLEKAVDGGFNAPQQISKDSDLKSLHGDPRYDAALAKATKRAAAGGKPKAEAWKKLAERVMDVPGMVDYVASVGYTDGYSVHNDAITALVPGAAEKPFYPVFGKRKPMTGFDRYLPKETVSFSVSGGVDLDELYAFVEATIRGLGSDGEDILKKWSAMQTQFGVDFRKDVLGWIHGNMVQVTMKQPMGDASVFMLKVNDEEVAREKLATALQFLSTNLQQMAQQQPMAAMLVPRTSPATHEKLPGFHNVAFGMMPQPAVCGVADGYLIIGSTADAVALCLATAAGEHPNIRENKRLMAEAIMPDGPFRSISFTDERNMGNEIAQMIGVLSMSGGMIAMAVPDPQAQQAITKILGMVSKLGPVAQKLDFYKSTAAYETFDGKAWHKRSVTNYMSPAERQGRGEG
jgi:hypothetical protein